MVGQWLRRILAWGVDTQFVFVGSDSVDVQNLIDVCRRVGVDATIIAHPGKASRERNWGDRGRIEYLADLRNKLLEEVRALNPEWFLSLDSDILVPSWEEFSPLFESGFDVVSPLAYLSPSGNHITNAFTGGKGKVYRRIPDYVSLVPATVVCAVKLMNRKAVELAEYGFHHLGEDFYFSEHARSVGVTLGFDPSVRCKHVMSESALKEKDIRVGW